MLILFSNHTWRQLLSFCGGAPVRFTISGCSTECPTGPQFISLSIILSQQTEQPPRSKAFFQAVPQSSKRHLQSCPQPIASLAEETGRALPSKWDIPCGHWQEWLEGGFFWQSVSLTNLSHLNRWLESQSSSWSPCREFCGSIKILSTLLKTTGSSVGGK